MDLHMLPSSSERKRKYCPHKSMPCVVLAMNSEAVIVEMQSAPAPSGARKMGTFIGMNDERKQNETVLEKPSKTYSLGFKKKKQKCNCGQTSETGRQKRRRRRTWRRSRWRKREGSRRRRKKSVSLHMKSVEVPHMYKKRRYA